MQTLTDRLRKHFGNKLAEGEELYTKENLKAINQIKSLIDEDLTLLLHKIVLLDLKTRLTTEGQQRLDSFIKRTEEDKWFNETVYKRFAKIVDRGFCLFLFAVLGDFERLTTTQGYTKNFIDPDLHDAYLDENPEMQSLIERYFYKRRAKEVVETLTPSEKGGDN